MITLILLSKPVFAGKGDEQMALEHSIAEIAKIYYASMVYIFAEQPLINQPGGSKERLFGQAFKNNLKLTYEGMFAKPFPDESNPYIARLLNLMLLVMEENKTLLLDESLQFKGFIPVIFAFQLSQKFKERGYEINIKFTNFSERVRNKMSLPDFWEQLALAKLAEGEARSVIDDQAELNGKPVIRYMRPVVMTPMCLTCHGLPQDNPLNINRKKEDWLLKDKTGFMMEGWTLDELGGGISVLLQQSDKEN